jgi:hypothetical protein
VHDSQFVLLLALCGIVAAFGYSWGRHSGWQEGYHDGIATGEKQMLDWIRSQGMKRKKPRVQVLSSLENEDE